MSVISSLMVKIGADSSGLKKELSNAQAAINSSFDTAAEAGMLSKIMSLTGGDVGSLSTAMMRLDKSFTASSEDGEKTRQILSAVGVSLTDTTGR